LVGGHYLEIDPHIQFIRELFLHVAEVHILLVLPGNLLFGISWHPKGHPRKASLLRHFWVFGSLQTLHMP
jgi:hypothetical protein